MIIMAKHKGSKRRGMSKEFLRKIRMKYHLGEFKGSRSRSRKATVKFIKHKRQSNSMAKRRFHRSKKSLLGGINLMKVLTYGAGAGFAGTLGAKVNNWSKGKLTGNVAEAGAGLLAYFVGKWARVQIVKDIGVGCMIKATGDFVEDNIVPKISGLNSETTNTNNGSDIVG
jgi:hypothetical protein